MTLRPLISPRFHLVALTTVALIVSGRGSGRPLAQTAPRSIVEENRLAGTPNGAADWDISADGEPTLQGFTTNISINTGDIAHFKIASAHPYRLDIFRLGYYADAGARFIYSVALPAQSQPACVSNDATGLVDCGNWAESASWSAVDATSGIYVAKITRTDGVKGADNGSSHILFVVRDDARNADIVVQTSDTTWQAYNRYGGASLYCAPVGIGASNTGTGYASSACPNRATKVSYNRPIDTRAHDPQSFVFNAEYPMVRFLEANGYNVKYISGVDTDRNGSLLVGASKPRIFISSGHDEYWSGQQRANVEAARNAGVSLAFFSGNEMFWKTRYEPSTADGLVTPFRTLVSYKETLANAKIDPAIDPTGKPIWTGTWRDPRFSPPADGGRPENGLTGTVWTVNSGSAEITVPASMARMRLWQHTRVADLTSGVAVLALDSLGYEWDEELDNGARPGGLVHLSSTTVAGVEKILDYGSTVGTGTATHNLTLYRHNSGAIVFGAGTVQWAWGLDSNHDRGSDLHVPDQAMQQATVTLLADMHAQPGSLQSGADPTRPLTAVTATADVFAPTSIITSPTAGGQVESGGRATITGTAVDNGGGLVASVEVSVDGGTTWRRAQGTSTWAIDWSPGLVGSATVRSRAIDDNGNVESAGAGVTVSVIVGACPCTSLWKPSVVPTNPSAADAAAYELGVKFKSDIDGFITGIRFYKGPANSGTHVGNLWRITGGAPLATATFTAETANGWQQVNFATPVAITANTTYVASYHTNVGGYAFDAAYFATAGVDSPPLHAVPSGPSGGNGVFVSGGSAFPNQTFNANNYWVDVVFAPSLVDNTTPTISAIGSRTIDSSRVTVTWTTDEPASSRIDYSTNPAILTATLSTLPAGTSSVTNGSFVTQHTTTLTGLQPNTTYYFLVTAADQAGNTSTVAAPTFTVPGPTLRDTALTDFAAGVRSSTYVSQTADGEVILAPLSGSEFTGPGLSPGWIEVPWDPQGYSDIQNGVLLVDGSRVATCVTDANGVCIPGETTVSTPSAIYSAPHSLEFSANFSGDQFQHAGLAVTFGSASEPWAIFSTLNGGLLVARTNTGAASIDTPLGTGPLGAFHRYRIDWKPASVDYYIDGALVASHAVAVTATLRPVAASDFNPFGGNVFVDWMRLSSYASPGTFQSRVFDAGSTVDWHTVQWIAGTPAGTSVAISVRSGNTPAPDPSWTAFVPVSPGPLTLRSRFIQYRAQMTSSDPNATPALEDIIISTGNAPVAKADTATVPENGTRLFPAAGAGSLTINDTDADPGDVLRVVAVTQPAHGRTTLASDGAVTYTPATDYSGPDTFTYSVSDGLLTATGTVSLAVSFQNVAPVANPDVYRTDEDTALTVPATAGILANDTDVEGNTLTAILVTPPAHGTLNLGANGSFTYTPVLNFAGTDVFSYKANDGLADGNVTTAAITISPVNDAPIGTADAFTVVMNHPLTVPAPGVLSNDRDVEVEDTAPLTALLVRNVAHGVLTLTADGAFTYTPEADFVGADTFTYRPVDHFGAAGNETLVTINVSMTAITQVSPPSGGTVSTGSSVTPADPLQTAVTTPGTATVTITQGVISASELPANFTFLNRQVNIRVINPDGTEFTSVTNPLTLTFTVDATLIPPGKNVDTLEIFRNGVLVPNCLGLTAIPAANMDPCITRRATDANNSAVITLLSSHASDWNMGVASANAAPVAQNDPAYLTLFQQPITVAAPGVLGNDYGRAALTAAVVAGSAAGGDVALASTGRFTFTPTAGFCGLATFKYTARDGTNESNVGTATIRVNCDPVAGNDVFTVVEDSGPSTLTVMANDSDPDADPTLSIVAVSQSANGTVAIGSGGTWVTYKPNANFFGTDTFTYTIADSRGGRDVGTVTMTVKPVDDVPSFVKGLDQTVREDSGARSIAAWATAISAGPSNESGQLLDFQVSTNNAALFAAPPAVAANGTLTYTPALHAFGSALVTIALHDNGGIADGGVDTSPAQTFTITVTPVNDAPSFVKGLDQTVREDAPAQSVTAWATAISAGPTSESGQLLNFVVSTNNAALFAVAPAIAANGTLTYTPASNIAGSATVTVALHDNGGTLDGGVDTSAAQTFTITVTAVNDAPSFVKGLDQTVREDAPAQSVTAWATAISAGPTNESGQLLNFVVSTNNAALFAVAPAIAANGTLTYTPAADAFGSAVVTVAVHDNGGIADGGVDTSAAQTFTITVTPVNDVPSFVKGIDQTVLEDAVAQSVTGWATAIKPGPANESAQALNFVVSTNNAALFAVAPAISASGVLTYTPAANAAGVATVTVALHDSGGIVDGGVDTSAAQTFTITVTAVNDAPSFVKGLDQTVLEDAGAQSVAGWATAISAGANESGQLLNFIVSTNNAALFAVAPAIAANGTLTYTPASNAAGSATVTVALHDNGGTTNLGVDTSAAQTFTITVTGVNDVPSFTKGLDQTVLEDSAAQTVVGWASAINPGATNESAQLLNFVVSTNNAALFAVAPAIAANGTLTYTPASNAVGSATVTVALHDDGGTANLGVDTSAAQTFTITVTAVNDAPTFTKGLDQTVLEDSAAQTVVGWASAMSAGPADESGQALNFVVSTTNATLFAVAPAVAANGTLTYTPASNATGSATVTVALHDNGGTANGGVDTSAARTFIITLTAVNDAPSFTAGADQAAVAGAGPQTVAAWATSISAGPVDEATQSVAFIATNDNNALFAVQPAISPTGTLTYTPAATGGGVARVTVRVQDSGGIANGGIDTSAPAVFTITLPRATTTTLASPTVSPTTYGQAVVLNATVTTADGTPVTGSIDFTDNGVLLGNVPLTNGAASLTTSAIGAGTARTVTAVYKPTTALFLTSQAAITRAVNALATTTTLTATPLSTQYSDVATFETTVTGLAAGAPAQSATFKVGTQIIGTANLTWDAAAGLYRAKYSGPLVESTYTSTGGPLKPGSKSITVTYNAVSSNYTLAGRSGSVAINREDAAVAYTGPAAVQCTTNCAAVIVPLSVKVSEIDSLLGDLRNANVTFVNRTTGLAIATVAVDVNGIASFNWTVNLGTATSQTMKIGMVVGNYYTRSNTLDDGTVVIKR